MDGVVDGVVDATPTREGYTGAEYLDYITFANNPLLLKMQATIPIAGACPGRWEYG